MYCRSRRFCSNAKGADPATMTAGPVPGSCIFSHSSGPLSCVMGQCICQGRRPPSLARCLVLCSSRLRPLKDHSCLCACRIQLWDCDSRWHHTCLQRATRSLRPHSCACDFGGEHSVMPRSDAVHRGVGPGRYLLALLALFQALWRQSHAPCTKHGQPGSRDHRFSRLRSNAVPDIRAVPAMWLARRDQPWRARPRSPQDWRQTDQQDDGNKPRDPREDASRLAGIFRPSAPNRRWRNRGPGLLRNAFGAFHPDSAQSCPQSKLSRPPWAACSSEGPCFSTLPRGDVFDPIQILANTPHALKLKHPMPSGARYSAPVVR